MSTADHSFPCYGAIPFRALCDSRLAGIPLALLGVIAAHDRFGKNGQGCTASQGRLAELVGCRREAINLAVTLLDQLGYITCGIDEQTGRRRSYAVAYDNAADNAAFRASAAPADRHRPKRSKACAPQRTSPAETCAPQRTSPSPAKPAPERASEPPSCAPERTSDPTEISPQDVEIAAQSQTVPIKEYIPQSGSEERKSGFSMHHEAGPEPPDNPIEDDLPSSQQLANERAWAKWGKPKRAGTLAVGGRR